MAFPGKSADGQPLQLAGILTAPQGKGPFPAIVMLPTCDGLREPTTARAMTDWAGRLAAWGYVTLQVDSLGPRGLADSCEQDVSISAGEAVSDAFAARTWLSTLSAVDAARIGVIGWSIGGIAVTVLVDAFERAKTVVPFKAAVAFYPMCASYMRRDTPLLILIGGKDDWFSARRCQMQSDGTLNGVSIELTLKVYPNATHLFDFVDIFADILGHHYEYDAEATQDAMVRTKAFLGKYLQGTI